MAYRSPIVNAILTGSKQRGLDPQAVLAVASVEGLGGGVGDQGTSFGPFQLHAGGALPRGISNPQAWAQSQAGINYALDRIAQVARGKHGRNAVAAIVSRFERPANVPGEIARASARYGGNPPVAPGGVTAPPVAIPGPVANRRSAALSLINQGNAMFGLDPLPVLSTPPIPKASSSTRVQAAPTTPLRGRTVKFLEAFAHPFGVTVTSTTGGKHARGSYHYKGRAVDFGGDPSHLAALARAALQHPQDFTELFYTGPGSPGYFIKNGRVLPNSQLDPGLAAEHQNHVHLAR